MKSRYLGGRITALVMAFAISLVGCGGVATLPSDTVTTDSSAAATENDIDDTTQEAQGESNEDSSEETASSEQANEEEEISNPTEDNEEADSGLDESQKNSIAMLNYLAVLSQEINSSKHSRMFLEEAYAALINNTNPEEVNDLTESHLASLLDIIEKYRMISVKRDRLQYIYEQNKAKALKEAMPNPIGLLSATSSRDLKQLAISAVYMAVDSYSSYKAYKAEMDLQYLQDGWELDDEEAENVHDSRKRAFMFMIDIVRAENLPGKLALNESSVEDYVTWKNNTNTYSKIQFFESQEATYEAFGDYWLTLASCYFDNKEYKKCLDCIDKYEDIQANIFRKDYNFAKILPIGIAAAKEVCTKDEYVLTAEKYLKILNENTENSDWSLKYFASQIYLDLYAQTGNDSYLDSAFDITLNNINYLVGEQKSMNNTYLSEVKEVSLPADPTKDASEDEKVSIKEQKKQIKKYNEALKNNRKTELPPVYEPLKLNCEMLFALAKKKSPSTEQKNRIEGILHQKGNDVFLTEQLNNRYTFSPKKNNVEAKFDKDTLTVPASCLSETSYIKVFVSEGGKTSIYDDWTVNKVDRKTDDIESFKAIYKSKKCGQQKWSGNSTVKVEIYDEKDSDKEPFVLKFKVSSYSKVLFLPEKVIFEQV